MTWINVALTAMWLAAYVRNRLALKALDRKVRKMALAIALDRMGDPVFKACKNHFEMDALLERLLDKNVLDAHLAKSHGF